MNKKQSDKYYLTHVKGLLQNYEVSLPEEELIEFLTLFKLKSFEKGEHIISLDEKVSYFGMVMEGLIRHYFNTFEGKELNQTFRCENEVFMNYYPHFTGKGSPFAIQALEPTRVAIVSYEEIETFYDKDPGWNILGRKLLEENFIIKAERERQLLTLDSTNRYLSFKSNFPKLIDRIPKQHIALYLGINPASLSRLIKAIKE